MIKRLNKRNFISICFAGFIVTRILATTAIAAKVNLIGIIFKIVGLFCWLALILIAYKEFDYTKQNRMLAILLLATAIGIYVTHYSFMGIFVPLTFVFIVAIVGFPRIIYLDFITRFSAVVTGIFIFGQFATKNVYNPVTNFHKYGLGFNNPNALGMILLGLLMELILINSVSPRKTNIFIWFGALPFLFATHCRTAIWSLVIFCITWTCMKKLKIGRIKWVRYFLFFHHLFCYLFHYFLLFFINLIRRMFL